MSASNTGSSVCRDVLRAVPQMDTTYYLLTIHFAVLQNINILNKNCNDRSTSYSATEIAPSADKKEFENILLNKENIFLLHKI